MRQRSRPVTLRMSWPSCTSRFTISNAVRASPTATASASSCCTSPRGAPRSDWTTASSIVSPPMTLAWSRSESASRDEPSACRAIASAAESVIVPPSDVAMAWSCAGERLHGEPAEVEPLAPPDDGRRHLVRLGGRQHEPHAGRRLLEDLQQRVERLARQPLRLVDDVDLLAAHRRRRRGAFAELTGILDAAVRRGVDLDDVQVLALADGDALPADTARLGRRALLAVDHLRQDPGRGRLAGPSRAAEQERVVQAVLADGAGQGTDDVVLPQHLRRGLRPVPPVQRLVLLVLRHVAPTLEK